MFFTNAADRLIRMSTAEWLSDNRDAYTNTFHTNRAFGLGNIPVWADNQMVYAPSVHRLLQLAANICDSMTNQALRVSATAPSPTNQYPSVFRPICERSGNEVSIVGYEEVDAVPATGSHPARLKPLDLRDSTELNSLTRADNVFGVPWIIGAKKGLPNLNEVAMQSVVEVTRKLQVVRPAVDAPRSTWVTNMLYVVGVSNVVGIEAWNSYSTAYPRDVAIGIINDVTMSLTNDMGYRRTFTTNVVPPEQIFSVKRGWHSMQALRPIR